MYQPFVPIREPSFMSKTKKYIFYNIYSFNIYFIILKINI